MNHLSLQQLPALKQKSGLKTPNYNPADISCGIAHISLGAFHRAHQAVYTDAILASQPQWGIYAIGARNEDAALCAKLEEQNGLYTLTTRDQAGESSEIIGSIRQIKLLPKDFANIIADLTSPDIKIISLTITEKGYYLLPTTGGLDLANPLVQADVKNIAQPQTPIGLVCAVLLARYRSHRIPITVMSCDNLPKNGYKTRQIVLDFCAEIDAGLRAWVSDNITFPNTMVDRITPVPTLDDANYIASTYQLKDQAPVAAEAFRQWILEDKFANGRPAWEKAGAQFVADVYSYELAKIRLLNVSHTIFAYPAYLHGYRIVADGAADKALAHFVRQIMDLEITPTLPAVPGLKLDEYKTTIINRFANPAIKDTWARICSDGLQKIANQLVPIIKENMAAGRSSRGLIFTLAGWIKYLHERDEKGESFPILDGNADRLRQLAQLNHATASWLLALPEVACPELTNNAELISLLDGYFHDIAKLGMLAAIQKNFAV